MIFTYPNYKSVIFVPGKLLHDSWLFPCDHIIYMIYMYTLNRTVSPYQQSLKTGFIDIKQDNARFNTKQYGTTLINNHTKHNFLANRVKTIQRVPRGSFQ